MNMKPHKVWVVDDDASLRWVMGEALREAGHAPRDFNCMEEVLAALKEGTPAVLITDIHLPGEDGLELLRTLRASYPRLPVVVVTAHSDLQTAVAAYQGGAFEYLAKPFDVDELIAVVSRALQTAASSDSARPVKTQPVDTLIGEAPAMQAVFRTIGRLSGTHLTVLITGESGTGKELVARALHRHSPRSQRPFIALNTAAIPAELLESELFGHERGAFTGANARRVGRFEQAHGGTLFLDEIGDMPPALQTRLLRVLAEGEFYRVGGHEPVKVNVRIIAATHQRLEKQVEAGRFREDLFHRLNVVQVHMPALRERRDDIPQLLEHFMQAAARELNLEPKRLTADAMAALRERDWPGNVRELRNICRRLTLMASGRIVHRSDLAELLNENENKPFADGNSSDWRSVLRAWTQQQLADGKTGIFSVAAGDMEKVLIEAGLESSGGHRQEAAKLLGIGRNTLTRKLKTTDSGQ
ncbi:MAG TPA: nitrogen regulation protein NR(I) [Gammaproteobacteria bacterium]|nr:nitrogen regulation protein NR(I) [Gammaproteobacteria bacterium]